MTLHTDHHLMTAQHPTPDDTIPNTNGPADRDRGEEVRAVGKLTRRSERKRAWDELSEIDRAVLLEAVRQRRAARAHQQRVEAEIYRSRVIR